MKCLVVAAHPVFTSLCMTLTNHVVATLDAAGHSVDVADLHRDGFQPALTQAERVSYYAGSYDDAAVKDYTRLLAEAEGLVFVFPTWWFGFPAILKGWFDRVWAPGIAYDHAPDFGPIRPRLHGLKHVLAITTLGAPWWVDVFVMRRPVRRIFKIALLQTSAPASSFDMLSFYRCERLDEKAVNTAKSRISRALGRWGSCGKL